MALPNDEYWALRATQLENALHDKSQKTYDKVSRIFDSATHDISKELESWYSRLVKNNEMEPSYVEAKKLLTKAELEEFKWTVNEYIAKGIANGLTNGAFSKQLENASARVHISRLEAIKYEIQAIVESTYGQYLEIADSQLRKIYKESYYHNAFNLFQGINLGWTFAELDEDHLTKILSKPWAPDGKNFSQRIWQNQQKIINEAHQLLSQHLILGSDPQIPIDALAKKMNTSKYNAGRLIMTESAYFSSEARQDCFDSLDVEQYRVVATLDMKTSAICQDMDGKVFEQKDYKVGETAPPFHVYCRSTTAPYFADMDAFAERIARGEDGKTYMVPADMKYKEWYSEHIEGNPSKEPVKIVSPKDDKEYQEQIKRRRAEYKAKHSSTHKSTPSGADERQAQIRKRREEYKAKQAAKAKARTPEERTMDLLMDANDHHVIKNDLHRTLSDELRKSLLAKPVDWGKAIDKDVINSFNDALEPLINEYDTPLNCIRVMDDNERVGYWGAFAATSPNYEMATADIVFNHNKVKNKDVVNKKFDKLIDKNWCARIPKDKGCEYIITHEFGHTLLNMKAPIPRKRNWAKKDYTNTKKARKEIQVIYDEYMADVTKCEAEYKKYEKAFIIDMDMEAGKKAKVLSDKLKETKISTYSMTNVDEFLAESFANEKLGLSSNKYAARAVAVLDKYFKR